MQQDISPAQATQMVNQALDLMARDTPALRDLIEAFRPLKSGQAALSAGLPPLDSPLPSPDAARLAQGVPLATVGDFLTCQGLDLAAYLAEALKRLGPALAQGFPPLRQTLEELAAAEQAKAWDGGALLAALLAGEADAFQGLAQVAGLPADKLEFILLELARPLLARRSQALGASLVGQDWRQGTCPVCGSLPEMAFLQGEGGQRWLRCSLCAHHWRFARTICPVCGNEDQDKLEFFFAEGRERERVDLCRQCGKYVVTLDVRGLDSPPAWEVAALGLAHLDWLAQERGLAPAAWTPWNRVD